MLLSVFTGLDDYIMGLSKCGSGSKQAAVSMYVLLLGLHTTYKIRPCLFSYLDFFFWGGHSIISIRNISLSGRLGGFI